MQDKIEIQAGIVVLVSFASVVAVGSVFIIQDLLGKIF